MSSTFDESCEHTPVIDPPETSRSSIRNEPLDRDYPCTVGNKNASDAQSGRHDSGCGDKMSQTNRDNAINTDNPNSLTDVKPPSAHGENVGPCSHKGEAESPSRNPITGMGLNGDGVGGIKPIKPKTRRDGNPVTGEGYKSAAEGNHFVALNGGGSHVIKKNRVPPGGYSSGLW